MILKLIFTFIFFNLLLTCFGQTNSEQAKQQLIRDLKKDLPDTTRQKLYNDLGKLFLSQSVKKKANIDSAFYFLRKSVYAVDSTNIANHQITNESLCLLAETYFRSENLTQGKNIFNQVIRSYQKAGDKTKEAETWYRTGVKLAGINSELLYIQSCFDHSLFLFTKIGNIKEKIDVVIGIVRFYILSGNSALAEKELLNSLKESEENGSYKLANLYLLLAYINRYKGNFMEGMAHTLTAEKILERNNDSTIVSSIYGELALEYQELNQPENSIYWYKKCIAEREKENTSQYVIYRTFYLMVVQMIKAGLEKEALEILQKVKISSPPIGSTENAILSQSLAYCFNAKSQFGLAEKYFLAMIKGYNQEDEDREVLFIANYDIGKFYVDRKQFNKAEPYLKEAFTTSNSTTISRVKELHLFMFKVDSANGDFTSAINHFQKYKVLNDSIFSQAKSKQIEELMIKYEVEKKDNDIKLFEKENKLQLGKLKQAADTRNWILGGVILLLIIMGLQINNSRLKQRANKKLRAQQSEIEKKNGALQHLVREKEWLVKEIHHRVKNNFHIVMGLLGTQSQYLKTEEAIQAMAESQHRVQAMSLIHQKLYQSDNLSAINMTDYIHELVDYLRDSFNIRQSIQFNLQIDPINLDLTHCIPLGLILNEAITNSIKYAFPDNKEGIIYITFKYVSENHLLLTMQDNGSGLPPGFNAENSSSMGMKLMHGLSEDIDGNFAIIDHGGTEIKLDFIYNPDITNGITQMKTNPTNSI